MELDILKIGTVCGSLLGVFAFIGQLKAFFSSGEKQLAQNITDLKALITEGHAENRVQLAAMNSKLTEHDRRVQTLESEMKHMPDRDTAHRLEMAMVTIAGRLDTLDEKLKPIAATNERMNELLVEQARR